MVTFYADVNFEGFYVEWDMAETQMCTNLACYDNRASSVKWEGLPTVGSFSGKARIAFFTRENCTGDSRDWPTDAHVNGIKGNYPSDFTLDGINDAVMSFMIWQDDKKISNGIYTPCPLLGRTSRLLQ
ncbi:hypothetical protein PF005_g21483 [Phytophthora fragariae]|uniref:Uncharacterized protein n=1 Tax=Phytophthora fragariae TaxID=53985 RepID=A0A6A4CD57_9STRA|nr:hypothetical protein PF003_g17013 [Phytophthora fragariae]KAE8927334.1 hypothetical protein PF009_g22496 [Phytophthora fragariae]KAE8986634.1 hypothetical protein PF011_g19902 [Phytophthora fragariae]KAE9084325.1 hypothetical protein PF007_g21562 [Phytophthora fragariae]KAE9084606.1 hypothetical protein PF010_g20761 [Phytophthora fragariae]